MSVGSRIRVFLAEDHPIFLEGLSRAIRDRPELDLVATAIDGRSALDQLRELDIEVAVLDVRLPKLTGIDILRAVRRDDLGCKVLLLSGETSGQVVFDAVREGASGYLTKESEREAICDAISAVHRGETVLAAQAQGLLAAQVRGREHEERTILSARELEVLRLIANGVPGPEVAKQLHISPATVKTHLQNLYEKLGVSGRAAAVAEAMRQGLVE